MKKYVLFFYLTFFMSCGLLSEKNKPVVYNSESYSEFKFSKAPDYKNINSWAVHPSGNHDVFKGFNQNLEDLPVDVFFYLSNFTNRQKQYKLER